MHRLQNIEYYYIIDQSVKIGSFQTLFDAFIIYRVGELIFKLPRA